jgi:hypothetical protein
VAEVQPNHYVVRDANKQQLAYVYYESEPGRRSAAKLLTKDEARSEILSAGRIKREGLRAALQFFRRIAVSVHNALNRMIASRTGKNL